VHGDIKMERMLLLLLLLLAATPQWEIYSTAAATCCCRVCLLVKLPDEQPTVLATLTAGVTDTVLLDQFLTEYAELLVQGPCPVHVTGYYSPSFGAAEEDEDEEDEDYEVRQHSLPTQQAQQAHPAATARANEGAKSPNGSLTNLNTCADLKQCQHHVR